MAKKPLITISLNSRTMAAIKQGGWSASARGGPTGTAPAAAPAPGRGGCPAGAAAAPGPADGRPSGSPPPRSRGRAPGDLDRRARFCCWKIVLIYTNIRYRVVVVDQSSD